MPILGGHVRSILRLALFGYVTALATLSTELWLTSRFHSAIASAQLVELEQCALQGTAIEPAYRVRLADQAGASHVCCCIQCASVWLKHQPTTPHQVFVTDETSGNEIPAETAWFVRSEVITTPTTGNRIHAFKTRADAERHAQSEGGTVLMGAERPFAHLAHSEPQRQALSARPGAVQAGGN